MKFISVGATRYVLIVCGYALKFPRASSWRSFLAGLLHNMNERAFSRMNIDLLCPIVASAPGGFLNVMPVCQISADCESLRIWRSAAEQHEQADVLLGIVEMKPDSVGLLHGRLVAVDYGTY
ncbi:TPA: hypothetical protein I9751_002657 [Serratia marcescens]|nr:hypothetical protein [Serratia marcescens]